MSIANDLRGYADNAMTQGKHALEQAQAQVHDLRATAEKAVNIDAIRTAVEPYLAQARDYRTSVTDRAESLLSGVASDERVARLVGAAGSVVGVVQERVVKPLESLTGRAAKPVMTPVRVERVDTPPTEPAATKPTTKPATEPTTKPATKPATKAATKPTAKADTSAADGTTTTASSKPRKTTTRRTTTS